ncbi:hypothetical protein ACFL6C_13745, partial [Myxococcota bacterium]
MTPKERHLITSRLGSSVPTTIQTVSAILLFLSLLVAHNKASACSQGIIDKTKTVDGRPMAYTIYDWGSPTHMITFKYTVGGDVYGVAPVNSDTDILWPLTKIHNTGLVFSGLTGISEFWGGRRHDNIENLLVSPYDAALGYLNTVADIKTRLDERDYYNPTTRAFVDKNGDALLVELGDHDYWP